MRDEKAETSFGGEVDIDEHIRERLINFGGYEQDEQDKQDKYNLPTVDNNGKVVGTVEQMKESETFKGQQ